MNSIDISKLRGARKSAWDRDGGRCRYCGDVADNIDHVRPSSRGGGSDVGNLVASCYRCNSYKADRLPEECLMFLLKPGTAHTPEYAAAIRQACHRNFGRVDGMFKRDPTSRQITRRNRALKAAADEAAARPDNLHYPWRPARSDWSS